MATGEKIEVKNSTIQNYTKSIKNWIIPSMGNMEIKEIYRKNLQDFVINFSKGTKGIQLLTLQSQYQVHLNGQKRVALLVAALGKILKFQEILLKKKSIYSQKKK